MNTLPLLAAASIVLGPALLARATAQSPPEQRAGSQQRMAAAPGAATAPHQLSVQERAELRRQLAEYSRPVPRTTAPNNCKPPVPCRSSD